VYETTRQGVLQNCSYNWLRVVEIQAFLSGGEVRLNHR